MPRRCFEYNCRLILHYDAAVFTTVLYLLPGSDREAQDAFRLYVGDQVAYEWRFDVVRLWEIDAQVAIQIGEAGPLALVPLLRGGDEPDKVLAAVRMLDALPRSQSADAMSTLLDLASQRYDRATFWNVLGKDRVMQSWLWQMGRDEGEARGRAEGVLAAIEACDQPETLRAWVLQCPKLSDAGFGALVTGKPAATTSRSRTSRPSRASRRVRASRKDR